MFNRVLHAPLRSRPSEVLLCNFIEIALRHGCSPVNLHYIFGTSLLKNSSGGLPLTSDVLTFSLDAK